MTHKTTIEIEIEVDFEATPYDPGVCHGPPEHCYPPEGGEVEIAEVTFNNQIIQLTDEQLKKIEEEIQEALAKGSYDSEPDYDDMPYD